MTKQKTKGFGHSFGPKISQKEKKGPKLRSLSQQWESMGLQLNMLRNQGLWFMVDFKQKKMMVSLLPQLACLKASRLHQRVSTMSTQKILAPVSASYDDDSHREGRDGRTGICIRPWATWTHEVDKLVALKKQVKLPGHWAHFISTFTGKLGAQKIGHLCNFRR